MNTWQLEVARQSAEFEKVTRLPVLTNSLKAYGVSLVEDDPHIPDEPFEFGHGSSKNRQVWRLVKQITSRPRLS